MEPTNSAAYIAVCRKLSFWKSLFRTENIADAAHCMNYLCFGGAAHFRAQPANVGFNDIGLRVEAQFPHVLQEHRARYNASGILQKILQKLEFLMLQFNHPVFAPHGLRNEIHFERARVQMRSRITIAEVMRAPCN